MNRFVVLLGLFGLISSAQAQLYPPVDGQIRDDVLNLFWLQDGNMVKTECVPPATVLWLGFTPPAPVDGGSGRDKAQICADDGRLNLAEAKAWIDYLNAIAYKGHDNWRLPVNTPVNGSEYQTAGSPYPGDQDFGFNIHAPGTLYANDTSSEMAYMFYQNLGNEGQYNTDGSENFPTPSGWCEPYPIEPMCLVNQYLFLNLQYLLGYWSDSSYQPGMQWGYSVGIGSQASVPVSTYLYVWPVRPNVRALTVVVDESGGATGSVASNPPGVDCGDGGTDCTVDFILDTQVQLTATPGGNSVLEAWGGACDGFDPAGLCTVLMDVSKTVTATFVLDFGGLSITKTVEGGTDPDTNEFSIQLDCTDDGFDAEIQLLDGETYTVVDIPAGTQCTVTEDTLPTPPAGYSYGTPEIAPAQPVTIVSGETAGVTVTNNLLAIRIDKTVYQGHDNGASCATAVDELVVVDSAGTGVPVTFCFVVDNPGATALDNILIDDPSLGIDQNDLTLASGAVPLVPGAQLVYFYEDTRTSGIVNTTTVTATPAGGTDVTDSDTAEVVYVVDPPFGLKTVVRDGQTVLVWTMVWINNSTGMADHVEVYDEIPAGTTFDPSGPDGPDAPSPGSGVYCDARGVSVTNVCEFDAATGRVLWSGMIGPDFGASDEATANNEVVIQFQTIIDAYGQPISNQGHSTWDMDGDGGVDFTRATGTSPDNQDPTVIVPWARTVLVPTLTFWGLALLTVLLGLMGSLQRRTK